MKIEKNSVVTMEYTLTNPAGEVLDTSKGRAPLRIYMGRGVDPGVWSGSWKGRRRGTM